MIPFNLTAQQLRHAAEIKQKIDSLQNQLNNLLGGATSHPKNDAPKKRKMSAAGRKAIAAAAKARWAKYNAAKSKPAKRAKKKISAAGIARIRAAQKARWAKIKAAKA